MPEAKVDATMVISKVAFVLALVLATASAALAAPKQASHHQTTIQRVPAGSHLSLNTARSTGSVRSTGPANQSNNISPLEYEGLAHLIAAIDEIGTDK